MSFDVFERLREAEVPEMPTDIDEKVHKRVNTSLTANHLVDFLCGALPSVVMEFINPFGALVNTTFSNQRQRPPRGQ
jgi:hypothetical protein